MDPKGVTLHQRPPAPARYAAVIAWIALVKGHFAREQRALEAWIADWPQDADFMAWAQPQIAVDMLLQGSATGLTRPWDDNGGAYDGGQAWDGGGHHRWSGDGCFFSRIQGGWHKTGRSMRIALWFDRCARAKGGSTMPMSGPITRRSYMIPGDDFQDGAIDTPDGENLM